jgi:hypothetical protein
VPMAMGDPARFHDVYSRHATCYLLSLLDPFRGWRQSLCPPAAKLEFAQGKRESM